MDYEETKYTINYWYDNLDSSNPFKYVLKDSNTFTGYVGQVIETVDDIMSGLQFRTKANLPITLTANESNNVINIYYSSAYREYMYNLGHDSLTASLITPAVNTFLKLIGLIYGDLYNISKNIDDAINVDFVDEEHLRHLCKIIGYEWVEALTADEQRESIKFYMYLRRMRGTAFGLKNLIRIFGQTTVSLYQISNNRGVRVFDYSGENNKLDHFGLFPGDIRVEIPELSKILRDAANEVKLMGTRLRFAYRIDISSTNEDIYGHVLGYRPTPGDTGRIYIWLQPSLKGWDTEQDLSREDTNELKFIYKYVDTYNIHSSSEVSPRYSEPFTEIELFDVPGRVNVRGWLTDNTIISEDLVLYK